MVIIVHCVETTITGTMYTGIPSTLVSNCRSHDSVSSTELYYFESIKGGKGHKYKKYKWRRVRRAKYGWIKKKLDVWICVESVDGK